VLVTALGSWEKTVPRSHRNESKCCETKANRAMIVDRVTQKQAEQHERQKERKERNESKKRNETEGNESDWSERKEKTPTLV